MHLARICVLAALKGREVRCGSRRVQPHVFPAHNLCEQIVVWVVVQRSHLHKNGPVQKLRPPCHVSSTKALPITTLKLPHALLSDSQSIMATYQVSHSTVSTSRPRASQDRDNAMSSCSSAC